MGNCWIFTEWAGAGMLQNFLLNRQVLDFYYMGRCWIFTWASARILPNWQVLVLS
jgi:hypothetical protein